MPFTVFQQFKQILGSDLLRSSEDYDKSYFTLVHLARSMNDDISILEQLPPIDPTSMGDHLAMRNLSEELKEMSEQLSALVSS
mmetsp:Transcript_9375/g.14271  ORF Transcript_9375/g.14271 Transcript_9375/m.14271 type:complete len:83 (+) Transcript_9375:2171-2419(+)